MSNKEWEEWQNGWSESALDNSNIPVLWLSQGADIIRFNPATLDILGYNAEELISLTLFDLNEELTKKKWKERWSTLLKEKTMLIGSQIVDKEDKPIYVELNFTLISIGKIKRCFVVLNEVPETLKTDQQTFDELHKSQRRNQSILDSAGEGIYGLDTLGHTTFVNKAAARMIGWELDDLAGKSQHAILHHSKTDGSPYEVKECPIYAAFKDGKTYTVDNEVFWRKDGTSFPVEYTSTPIKDENGKLLGAVVVFKDITERKEAERALKESNTDLQKAIIEVQQLKSRLENENTYLQEEIKLSNNFEEIISKSKEFKKVLSQVEQVASTGATVLITGESGTGKELIARAVHNLSDRKNRPLVKVNCAALPANLIESELFGHERGAFTGALTQRIGRFELADGGTIFLDEIGEIPIELQSKLLRVLQEGEFERLGSSKTFSVDVRVVTATNRKLLEEIESGKFREDLYYRLNVFPIHIPPLRERREDIPLLVNHFISKFENRFEKKGIVITKKVMNSLMNYHWTGNVRELENVIERALIISKGNKLDLGDSLPKTFGNFKKLKITTLEENERAHILKALEFTSWRVSGEKGAAKLLDMNRTTLEARMKKLGIERPGF